MTCINDLSPENWKSIVSESNHAAMRKSHKYPRYEGAFLTNCLTFLESKCPSSCFCQIVGCEGIWTLLPDLDFDTFLNSFANLWVRGAPAFKEKVDNSVSEMNGRWAGGIRLLREVKKRWSNWDGTGKSLPSVVSAVRHSYFCDESFNRITPIVETIGGMVGDTTGVYTSKLVSQLFYDIAVPFDTASAGKQRKCGYDPRSYGAGKMCQEVKGWLLENKMSINDFRRLDDASESCWLERDRQRHKDHGAPCSRVLDKLFYA